MSKIKIGVGIITCNRIIFLQNLLESIIPCKEFINNLIVVNDGEKLDEGIMPYGLLINNDTNKQVGECKNIAMRYLLDSGCDYIFTIEDDILIKDPTVFDKYIQASKETGIEHFNFGFSQRENLDKNLNPVYKKIIEYKNCKLVLTPNILGAFTFFTRNCLQSIGLHHPAFNKGHGDHPELTYRAYKHGYTTPFWWFADLYESWKLLGNQSDMSKDSIIRNQEDFILNFTKARNIFCELHGVDMLRVPMASEKEVISILKKLIKKI